LCCVQCEPIKYTFSSFEFAWHFDIEREYTMDEQRKLQERVDEFSNLCSSLWGQLKYIEEDPIVQKRKQLFLSDLAIKLNQLAEEKVRQFAEVFTDDVTPQIYADYISAKKRIARPLNVMLDRLQALKGDELNFRLEHYRKCNHCGMVWYKTPARIGGMGCDGYTTCGKRMMALEKPEFEGLSFSFTVDCNFTINWELRQRKSSLQHTSTLDERLRGEDEGVGCGNDLTWNEMATITSEELDELKIKVSDLPDDIEVVSMDATTEDKVRLASAGSISGSPKLSELCKRLANVVDAEDWQTCDD